jgi:hypothetical protein
MPSRILLNSNTVITGTGVLVSREPVTTTFSILMTGSCISVISTR